MNERSPDDIWDFLPDVTAQLDDKSLEKVAEERKRRIKEIYSEEKMLDSWVRKEAVRFVDEIQRSANSTTQYQREHIDAEERYREQGKATNQHEYTFTLGASRYKLYSTNSEGSRTIRFSRREIDPSLSDEDHRIDEAKGTWKEGFWTQKVEINTGKRHSSLYSPSSIMYEGPDPYEDESLGTIKITNTHRAAAGIEMMIRQFGKDRSSEQSDISHLDW